MDDDRTTYTNAPPYTAADFEAGMQALKDFRRRSIERIAKDESLTDEQMEFVATYAHTDTQVYVGSALWPILLEWAARPGNELMRLQIEARWQMSPYLSPDAVVLEPVPVA